MLVHIVADHPDRIAELRLMFGSQYCVSSSLLASGSDIPAQCAATIISTDLRTEENITALKELSAKTKTTRRRIFIIGQKSRLLAARAYALGATHALFRPVNQGALLAALTEANPSTRIAAGTAQDPAGAAATRGAASLASMFAAVVSGHLIDVADAKDAAREIAESVTEDGFSNWLDTVRRHHEGTYQHCLLVTGTAVAFGLSLGLAKADIERLYSAAMFHDIGKAKIPIAVLDKPGQLDPQERALIQTHPAAGYDVLKGNSGISAEILDAVRHHHEYLDGSGYPDALCAENISDLVRIITISDIFAALIEDRRYKPSMPRPQAYEILGGMRGKLEGPLVTAFKEVALNC
jgi:putative nucleotidyltransferase with HDIG domain